MSERPVLSKELNPDTFLQYYYLKEELISFCKENGLSKTGGKQDISKRIEHFLRTGEKLINPIVKRKNVDVNLNELSLDSIIEENFVCSEKHRAFFKAVIGNNFSFNVTFQKYLKTSAGKTYSDAVNEWYKIQEAKKNNKGNSPIDNQFEYNTYIRDFFKDNSDKTLKEAIKCWKFKKGAAGHNKYERQDLCALEK
ncbi:DUF6434 domain-containing protein [Clostridium sp. C8-1-8]|uniref:DUF6434 domain-containing protein n=1 Tax=Clostridium sp. C8-1-8 TaxID=2698831 RepID=UPI00136E7F22|nr:DUF6434 domain-containing protein [Clostridium sp. C8-1-8]